MNYLTKIILLFIFLLHLGCKSKPTEKAIKVKKIENTTPALEKSLIAQNLVNIQEIDSTIKVDLKYSTTDNFFGEDVYEDLKKAFCQPVVADALKKANTLLKQKYPLYRLLIYDAARPLHVQKILWNKLDTLPPHRRQDFVANPKVGSIHNYGCAIDLTIYDIKTQKPLDMGTKYDYFGYLAYPRMEKEMLAEGKSSNSQILNRQILRNVMLKNGFKPITSEWWHFNYLTLREAKTQFRIIK